MRFPDTCCRHVLILRSTCGPAVSESEDQHRTSVPSCFPVQGPLIIPTKQLPAASVILLVALTNTQMDKGASTKGSVLEKLSPAAVSFVLFC